MRVAPYQGSTLSWVVSSVIVVALLVLRLTGLTPRQLYAELWGIRQAFTSQDAALLRAAGAGDVDGARRALADGARVSAIEPDAHDSALVLAARGNHAAVVEFLLREGADADHRANQNRTAFDEAVEHASPDVVRLLLTGPAGAKTRRPDVNREGGDRDRPPLSAAIERYRASTGERPAVLQIVRMLLEAGADPNLAGSAGRGPLPLALAMQAGRVELVSVLLDAGANASAWDPPSGDTMLTLAVDTCAPDGPAIVAALLAHGAHADARGSSGRTARERHRAAASTRDDCRAILSDIGDQLR